MSFTTFGTFLYTPESGPSSGDAITLTGHFTLPDPPPTTSFTAGGASSTIISSASSSTESGPRYNGAGWGNIPPFIISLVQSEAQSQKSSSSSHNGSGINGASIAGIVIGAVAVLAITLALFFVILQQRRSYRGGARNEGERHGSRERVLHSNRGTDEVQETRQSEKFNHLRNIFSLLGRRDNQYGARTARKAELPASATTTTAGRSATLVGLQSPQDATSGAYMSSDAYKKRMAELSDTQLYEIGSVNRFSTPEASSSMDSRDALRAAPLSTTFSPKGSAITPGREEISTSVPSKNEYELNANPSFKDRGQPEPAQQFPYEGLLKKHVEKRH